MSGKSIIAALVISAVALLVIILSLSNFRQDGSASNETKNEIKTLDTRKKSLEYEIGTLRTELDTITLVNPGIFIMFDHYSEFLESDVAELLEEAGMSGIIVATPEEASTSGIMSLCNAFGWEIAAPLDRVVSDVTGVKNIEAITEYLERYEKSPIAAYMSESKYHESFSSALEYCGIKALVTSGSSFKFDYFSYDGKIIKTSALDFSMEHTISNILNSRVSKSLPVVISILDVMEANDLTSKDQISLERFKLMLETVSTKYPDVAKGKIGDYSDGCVQTLEGKRSKYNELLVKIADKENELAEINEKLNSIVIGE